MARKTLIAALLAAVGAVDAARGELVPVACDPDEAGFPPMMMAGMVNDKPGQDRGVLTEKARIGTATVPGGKLSIQFALDYSKADTDRPDVLYVDFAGKGKFDKLARKCRIALKPPKAGGKGVEQVEIGPARIEVRRGGKTFPLVVRGMYMTMGQVGQAKRPPMVYVGLSFAPAVEGKCTFGKRDRRVRLVDNTGDFRFDQKGKFDRKDPQSMGMPPGDTVLVDTGDGTFTRSVIRVYYGQPVFVDGAWYDVSISPDGGAVAAKRVDIKSGKLAAGHDRWEVVLEGGGKILRVTGGREAAAVPCGTYKLMYFRQWSAPDAAGKRGWLLTGLVEFMGGPDKAKTVTIAAGQTARLTAGAALQTTLAAKAAEQGVVRISLSLKDQGEMSVMTITAPGGGMFSRPDPPKVTVLDKQGKTVHTAALEYG